jgi:hypothetical protein
MWGEDEVDLLQEHRGRNAAQALGLTAVSMLLLGWALVVFGPPFVRYMRMRRM